MINIIAVLIVDKHATITIYKNIDLTSANKIVFSLPRINISAHSGKGGKRVFMVILREMLRLSNTQPTVFGHFQDAWEGAFNHAKFDEIISELCFLLLLSS